MDTSTIDRLKKLMVMTQKNGCTPSEEATAKAKIEEIHLKSGNCCNKADTHVDRVTSVKVAKIYKIQIVAVLKNAAESIEGYRLVFETDGVLDGLVKDVTTGFTKELLKTFRGINVSLDGNRDLIGIGYPLELLPIIYASSNTIKNDKVIVIAKVIKNGEVYYRVTDYSGRLTTITEKRLLEYGKITGICNAKVKYKNGKGYIEPLNGEFIIIEVC